MIGAIKALIKKVDDLATTVATFAEKITTKELIAINVTADRGTFNTLCVGQVCVTESQFMSVFGASPLSQSASSQTAAAAGTPIGESAAPAASPAQGEQDGPPAPLETDADIATTTTSASDNVLPVIHINGANPANISVGDTYADLGAQITGPQEDLNLRIHLYMDGVPADAVQLDTSQAGTHMTRLVGRHSGLGGRDEANDGENREEHGREQQ